MIFESKKIYFFKVQSIQSSQSQKCEPNSDLLKKMKQPRLALSTLLAHMLQAISDLAVQFKPDQLVPKLLICNALFCKISLPGCWKSYFGRSRF